MSLTQTNFHFHFLRHNKLASENFILENVNTHLNPEEVVPSCEPSGYIAPSNYTQLATYKQFSLRLFIVLQLLISENVSIVSS